MKKVFVLVLALVLLCGVAICEAAGLREYIESLSIKVYTNDEFADMAGAPIFEESPNATLLGYARGEDADVISWHDGNDGYICMGSNNPSLKTSPSMAQVFADICKSYKFDVYVISNNDQRIAYAPRKASLAKYMRQADIDFDVVCKSKDEFITMIPVDDSANTETAIVLDYVLNNNTMKFHLPDCKSVGKIKASNRSDYHGSREDLIARGYAPCKNCNP